MGVRGCTERPKGVDERTPPGILCGPRACGRSTGRVAIDQKSMIDQCTGVTTIYGAIRPLGRSAARPQDTRPNIGTRHVPVSELRREAVGRKNWLFVGNDDAGEVNATFVTLIASCEMHGVEPWAYLRDLFCLLPGWPRHRVLELSPARWVKTLEEKHAQKRFAADAFRQITLGVFDAQLDRA